MNSLIIVAIYVLIAVGFYQIHKSPIDAQNIKTAIVWPVAVGMLLANEFNKAESGDSKL